MANNIVNLLNPTDNETIIEIGPGQGILTEIILKKNFNNPFITIEIDRESVVYLQNKFNNLIIIQEDILHYHFPQNPLILIGNLPYNISSSILFKMLENHLNIRQCVFMLQKEVVERIVAQIGTKEYGILSVLLGTFFEMKKEFIVSPTVFYPMPKVDSAILTLNRHPTFPIVNFNNLKKVVKTAFGQRRKMLNNTLKSLNLTIPESLKKLRPEDISITDYIQLSAQL